MALAVVGAGFRRTGTNSLKVALEMLTLGPCHHMFEVLNDLEQLPFWQATAHGELPDWDQVFTAYSAAVDWPSARYWRGSGDDRSGTLADLRRRRGGQPLCQFLGVPVPKDAFPRTNSTAEFQTRVIAR